MGKQYCFDNWTDVDIIKENLNEEQCNLLHDILTNSKLIDDRPDDFDWETNDYGCETGYQMYYEGYFKVETSEKYKDFQEDVLSILLVQEGWEYIDYVIEKIEKIFDAINL